MNVSWENVTALYMRAMDSIASLQLPPCFRQRGSPWLSDGEREVTADGDSALGRTATFPLRAEIPESLCCCS